MSVNTPHAIDRWHDMMARGTTDGLYDLLHSPTAYSGHQLFIRRRRAVTSLFCI